MNLILKKLALLIVVFQFQVVMAFDLDIRQSGKFFKKDNFQAISTESICEMEEIKIQKELPENSFLVQKVFSQDFVCNDLVSKIEIFYHQRPTGNYLSQQVSVFKNGQQISLCTNYFPVDQKYLVPGACAASFEDKVWGFSIYR